VKVLVIADIHGNAEALRAVLDKERDADTTVFLGDSVSPGPQANETYELLKDVDGTFILGNHDIEMLEPELVAGWPAQWRALNDWVYDTFVEEGFDYLRTLKPGGDYEAGGLRLCLHHGTVPGKLRHALPDTPDETLVEVAQGSDYPFVLFGHSHVQFRRVIGDQEFINPGSVGQNRCGKLLACYGVFQDGEFEHRQVEYDPTPWLEAVDRIETLDEFPDFREWLKNGLLTGYGIGENEPWTRYAAEGYF
jgi:protein phosphatase